MNEAIFLDNDGHCFVVGKTKYSQFYGRNLYNLEIGEFLTDQECKKIIINDMDEIKKLHEFLTEFIKKSEVE